MKESEHDDDFTAMLKAMTETMREHPFWDRLVVGTPLENDLPVRAAIVALEHRKHSD